MVIGDRGTFCSRKTLESWHTAITKEVDNNSKPLPKQYGDSFEEVTEH